MADKSGVCAIVPFGQDTFRPIVFGMGVLVNEREIFTCAHVVDAALGADWFQQPGEAIVRVCFPFAEGACLNGHVDRNRWFPPGLPLPGRLTDIAIIVLHEDAPGSVGRAVLRAHQPDLPVKIYGFRGIELPDKKYLSHPEGEIAEGKVTGALPGGRCQFDGLRETGATIEKGFSGSGVYDPRHDAVVGMMVTADPDKPKKLAQFIDAPSLRAAFGRPLGGGPSAAAAAPRTTSESLLAQTRNKMREIEGYLQTIGQILPPPLPDGKMLGLLQSVLFDSPEAATLRIAFGFPAKPEKLLPAFELAAAGEPGMRPLLSAWAQRIDQILWRYGYTLEYVGQPWAEDVRQQIAALRTICEPHLEARQPTLREIGAILEFNKDLRGFTESAPDATLYAVMRSFRHSHGDQVAGPEPGSAPALDFLFECLRDLGNGSRGIDDSSNAWWAIRIGICRRDDRFRDLLPGIAARFSDVHAPPEEVSRLAAVPEIYQPIRTVSYTLSNIQAIFECDRDLDSELANSLHEAIATMLDRLLKTPRSNQLYLASVHHEGLRNYLDYVGDQHLPAV